MASGRSARATVAVRQQVPVKARQAWARLETDVGPGWSALWDRDTGAPLRVFGPGIHAPGTITNAQTAERRSLDFLKQHLGLLAPGSSIGDFILVSNELHRGIRSIGYKQMHQGIAVLGGQLSFRFKADRLVVIASEALPMDSVPVVLPKLRSRPSAAALQQTATSWVLRDSATSAKASATEGPFILPIISARGIQYTTVMAITVEAQAPLGQWQVFVDAGSGKEIARKQTLRFADGTLRYNVPVRQPLGERAAFPAQGADVNVNGEDQVTDAEGGVSWAGSNSTSIAVRASGPLVKVTPQLGDTAGETLTIAPDGTTVWDVSDSELLDAQATAFVHTRIVKDYARILNPNLSWLDEAQEVNVNIDDDCNAFSNGDSINFFVESSQCANTARLADVVYHEFGHSLHAHSIIEGVGAFDGAFSEGLSDYLAATITNDPKMGVGFFKDDAPLRHIDPDSREHVYPDDVGEVHFTGLIFAGAMWDLRKVLIAKYGEEEGVRLADQYFYGAVQRATSIPTTYVEVLLEDDDDGDLTNGTPNICDINATFGAHGLRALRASADTLSVVSPDNEGFEVNMRVEGLLSHCPGDKVSNATISWTLREDNTAGDEIEMNEGSEGLFTGVIPSAPDGQVVRYKVEVHFADGTSRLFPDNIADPFYEFYVGEIVELFCTDFEKDPFANGWTHGLDSGSVSEGADDWLWGPLLSSSSAGDPVATFSGNNVIGNDLGGEEFNGKYQADKVNHVLSPSVDVENYSDVRLQYRRWLTVEDAFFDKASIYANGSLAWQNLNSDNGDSSTLHHQDREWRFHDVPLGDFVKDNAVQIKYELSTDGGLEFGGWTIDDFCIVANANAVCGDGEVYAPEQCDLGADNSDTEADGCRTNCAAASCGDGVLDTGEDCDDGNTLDGDGCNSECLYPVEGGDCGCVVGGSRPKPGLIPLALLGFAGLFLLRRRRLR